MPRTAKTERIPYKPLQRARIDEIDKRRQGMRISIEALAGRAGMTERGLRRIRKSGRAWKREINALRMALRSIEADQKAETELFAAGGQDGGDDASAGTGGASRA